MRRLLLVLALAVAGCSVGAASPSPQQRDLPAQQLNVAPQATRRIALVAVGPNNDTATCSESCAVVGGNDNSVSGDYAFIGGGDTNTASGTVDVVGGGRQNDASGAGATISGGILDTASGYLATVGGGSHNAATGYKSTIAGGTMSTADAINATIGGGLANAAHGEQSVVAGGADNTASGQYGTVGGGGLNAAGVNGVVGGGYKNNAGAEAVVAGGYGNSASGEFATVPGGDANTASGSYSFAAGYKSQAPYSGDFVWSDSDAEATAIAPSAANQFRARAEGGFTLYTNRALSTGVTLAPGSGTWASSSDRRVKVGVVSIDDAHILDEVAALPVTAWSYRSERGVRHLGPMAQDFHAAFGLGPDDTHITSIDEDGVALAAIKALRAENLRLRAAGNARGAQIAVLREQLAQLNATVRALSRAVGPRPGPGEARTRGGP